MSKTVSASTLALQGSEIGELPDLLVQPKPGPPPAYSVELYRLFFADSADVTLTFEDQPIVLKQGHMLTLSPGESVAFAKGAKVTSLSFHHNFFCVRVQRDEVYCDGVVFNRLSGLPIVAFPEPEQAIIRANFKELTSILSNRGPFGHERALNSLRALLLHAAEFKLDGSDETAEIAEMPTKLSALVLSFQSLVEETYAERKGASFYSDTLGVTLSTLNRRVKEELGLTIMQAVNERLAIAARVALRSGERSVKDVALDLGFADPLYFSRFFKKQFGSPPSHYFQEMISGGAGGHPT